jgi:hypothetical protein
MHRFWPALIDQGPIGSNSTSGTPTSTFTTQPTLGTLALACIGWGNGTAFVSGSVTDNALVPNTYTLLVQLNTSTTRSAGIWSAPVASLPSGATKLAIKFTGPSGVDAYLTAWTLNGTLDTHSTASVSSGSSYTITPTTGGTATLFAGVGCSGGGISATVLTTSGYVWTSSGTATSSGANNGDGFHGTGLLASGSNAVVITHSGITCDVAGVGVLPLAAAGTPYVAYAYGPN